MNNFIKLDVWFSIFYHNYSADVKFGWFIMSFYIEDTRFCAHSMQMKISPFNQMHICIFLFVLNWTRTPATIIAFQYFKYLPHISLKRIQFVLRLADQTLNWPYLTLGLVTGCNCQELRFYLQSSTFSYRMPSCLLFANVFWSII